MKSYREITEIKDMDKTTALLKEYPPILSQFIQSMEFVTTPKTRLEYTKDLTKFYDYVADFKGLSCKDVNVKILESLEKTFFQDYLHYLKKYEKNGKIITNSDISIRRKLASIRKYFGYLFENDLISSNKVSKIKTPKLREKEIIRMNSEETADFVSVVENGGKISKKQREYHNKQSTRDLAIIYLMLSSGIRVSECVGLNLNDIDMKSCSIHIIRKGGKESTVWFSDEAASYLEEYIEERKRVKTLNENEQALFLSSRKQRLSVRSVEVLIKKYARMAVPLKHITPHKLRSTFASSLYQETGDIYLVGEILGHNDISTTKKSYAALSSQRKEKARNILQINTSYGTDGTNGTEGTNGTDIT